MNFLRSPFQQPVSAWSLFLVVGLVIVFAAMWSRIINHVVEA